jgi:hypothetical protein
LAKSKRWIGNRASWQSKRPGSTLSRTFMEDWAESIRFQEFLEDFFKVTEVIEGSLRKLLDCTSFLDGLYKSDYEIFTSFLDGVYRSEYES